MKVTASASAKTILFGEHAVVYGEPAIAIPLPGVRTYAELSPDPSGFRIISKNTGLDKAFRDLEEGSGLQQLLSRLMDLFSFDEPPQDILQINSDIPIASGLGSGAALSVSVIRAFSEYYRKPLTAEQINTLAYEIEKIYHGAPSGIDNTVIAYEKPIIFSKSDGAVPLRADLSRLDLLVVDSGIPSRTVDVVMDVRKNIEQNGPYIKEIGSLVKTAAETLGSGNKDEIGSLMNENHRLLCNIDVSCPELDMLIDAGRRQGAPGGKLTGAGRGGNFLILARDPEHAGQLKKYYESLGLSVIL